MKDRDMNQSAIFKSRILSIFLLIIFLSSTNVFAQYNSYIVKFKDNVKTEKLQSEFSDKIKKIFNFKSNKKTETLQSLNSADFKAIDSYYLVENNVELLSKILNNEDVEFIEPNYIYKIEQDNLKPNDPYYYQQWGMKTVSAEKAWSIASGNGVIVGVVDTGIDFEHNDLLNNLYINPVEDINHDGKFEPWASTEIKNGVSGDFDGIDNDGNGLADDIIGYDFINQDLQNYGDWNNIDPIPFDENGHGTMVSGVIAAQRNNERGISGLAYNSKIMMLRAFDASGNGESDDIANSILYAALNGAKVINCSFGEQQYSRLIHSAVKIAYNLGVTVVASSGNNGWSKSHFPSDLQEVISVGAINEDGSLYYRSNYGSNLSLVAPGVNILTTKVNNSYGPASGTSLSCPFVSATVAMLLEKDPTLKPQYLKGIIENSAVPYQIEGRTETAGAGILNTFAALSSTGNTDFSIISPKQFQIINKNTDTVIALIGSVMTPLFDTFSINIGKGFTPLEFTELSTNHTKQVLNDTIGIIHLSNLSDTVYTIQIKVKLKNNKFLEKRIAIETVSNLSPLIIENYNSIPVYDGAIRKYIINLKTNQNSFAFLKYRIKNSNSEFSTVSDNDIYSNFHTLLLNDLIDETQYEIVAYALRNDNTVKSGIIYLTPKVDNFVKASFKEKPYTLPAAYLLNQVKDIDNDNNPEIVLNNYKFGNWNKTFLYTFRNNSFTAIDSIDDVIYPLAFGNTNGDNKTDVLFKKVGDATVYQENEAKLFNNKIWDNDYFSTAATLFDIDRDGIDEIFSYNDNQFIVTKYSNNSFNTLFTISTPYRFNNLGSIPGFIIDDFDNDGNYEMVHSNNKGNVLIYQYKNDALTVEMIDSSFSGENSRFLEKADIDGDSINEIIFLTDTPINNYDNSVTFTDDIWELRIYKSKGINNYEIAADEFFYGTRVGDGGIAYYKNGVSCGNIDKKPGDEICVSAYPNLYIMKWDTQSKSLKPFGFFSDLTANACLIYDFDKNGINEIGFSDMDSTRFYEYNENSEDYIPPAQIWGWAIDKSHYHLNWIKPTGSTETQVWLYNPLNGVETLYKQTDKDTIIINDLSENYAVLFFKSVYPANIISYASKKYFFMLYDNIEPISADYKSKALFVKYNGLLPANISPVYFTLKNQSGEIIGYPESALVAQDSTVVLKFYDDLDNGTYTFSATSFFDYNTNPTKAKDLNFTVINNVPNQYLYLTSLKIISSTPPIIDLSYSQPINDDATVINNYQLSPVGKIINISKSESENNTVRISLEDNDGIGALGKEYTITANRPISSVDGMEMTLSTGKSMAFVFFNNNANNSFVYPNPIKTKEVSSATFSNLPARAKVVITTIEGELVNELYEYDANGGVEWNLRDNNNKELNSSVYLFKVIDLTKPDSPETEYKKFVIIR
jgi:subtilisin family serine protease/predicted HNH restriction endonuclease